MFGISRRRGFQVLKEERGKVEVKVEVESRIRTWKENGLSWREIGRLYKKSHEWARRAAEGDT